MKFDAIAFDLDGTLYAAWRFYIKTLPFYALKNLRLLSAFGLARNKLRKTGTVQLDFYDAQAAACAKLLNKPKEKTRRNLDKNIYALWQEKYKNIRLYPHALETLKLFRERGLKTALLTDFQIKERVADFGLSGMFDIELCSEDCGALKPHKEPFLRLSAALGVSAERILYVGNNFKCDIIGSKNAGFGAAALIRKQSASSKIKEMADLVFKDYRQLQDFVLN
ncbi:MAG: HAD family hydrolase [Termitinemataceae bacterium]|nr:MAG: HAD family hydrolase [Termitinemataceae bacterium]